MQEPEFYECTNLNKSLNKPDVINKGLFIVGPTGLGKTKFMKVFEVLFYPYKDYRFKSINAKDLVTAYEACNTPEDKEQFFYKMSRPILHIDDINTETIASNYGKKDVVEEVLFMRCEKGLKTYVTCNYTNSNNCIETTMKDLGKRYGFRMYDRFFEMFNLIEFKGKSYRC